MSVASVLTNQKTNLLKRKITCCSGKPLEPLVPSVGSETTTWPRRELGYGNNSMDWVIRMVITYGRYAKPMVSRQRLNGGRSEWMM